MGVRGIARILAPRRRGVLYVERLRIEPRRRLAAAATGTRSVAVILVNFQDDTSQPWTKAQIESTMFTSPSSVAAYYAEQSFGQLTVTGTVFDWVTIPYSKASCDYFGWYVAAVSTVGVSNVASHTNVMLVFPQTSACGWAGLASLGGGYSWINGATTLRTMAHELGHNLGVDHARTWTCTDGGVRVWLSASCSLHSEYGDPFSIMGAATTRHFNGLHKEQLGWIPDASRLTVTSTGTFTVEALGASAAGVQSLRIPRSSTEHLFVDLRQAGGPFETYAGGSPAVSGVMVRLGAAAGFDWDSRLLDTTPSTATYDDAALLPGRTVTDPVSGIAVTAVSLDASGATVTVTVPADATPPSAPASSLAWVLPDGSVQLSWAASTDDRGVDHYRIFRDGVQVATTAGTFVTDTSVAGGGTFTYAVVAVDAAGNASGQSPLSVVTVADTQAPTAPGAVTATVVETGNGRAVRLAWPAGSDNVAVSGYLVRRDGADLGQVAELGLLDAAPTPGEHAYAVLTLDGAGNRSQPASVTVTVPRPDEPLPGAPAAGGPEDARPDTSAPGAPRGLVARALGRLRFELRWRPAGDGTRVARYLVVRNGKVIARTRELRIRLRLARRSRPVVSVLAVDTAGNVGRAASVRLAARRA
jgi:hypothetical protein